ncbi:Thioredoxin-1 [compost metagenome]
MSKPIPVEASQFPEVVLRSSTPVLVDFWAPWCGPCRMVAPVLEDLAQSHPDKLKVVKVNTDENPDVAVQYGIMSIPTLMLFKDGNAVDRMVGFMPKASLESRILPKL